jgi:hypothetical protein
MRYEHHTHNYFVKYTMMAKQYEMKYVTKKSEVKTIKKSQKVS